jgi:hypothetical protein
MSPKANGICSSGSTGLPKVILTLAQGIWTPYPDRRTPNFCDVSGDVVDGGRNLGLEVGRQWDVAERGEALLSDGDRRLHERLHRLADIGIGVFGADDFVAGQQDWVRTLRSGGIGNDWVGKAISDVTIKGQGHDPNDLVLDLSKVYAEHNKTATPTLSRQPTPDPVLHTQCFPSGGG